MAYKPSPAARGRLGGLTTAARYDGLCLTRKARRSFIESFTIIARDEATRQGEDITDAEAARRGEALRRLWYSRLAHKSVAARRRRDAA